MAGHVPRSPAIVNMQHDFTNTDQSSVTRRNRLIGEANEMEIRLMNKTVLALLDTGSAVSTISEEYLQKYFPDVELQHIDSFFDIQCANGGLLPYSGIVEVQLDIKPPGCSEDCTLNALLLVVPTTSHGQRVPILVEGMIIISTHI